MAWWGVGTVSLGVFSSLSDAQSVSQYYSQLYRTVLVSRRFEELVSKIHIQYRTVLRCRRRRGIGARSCSRRCRCAVRRRCRGPGFRSRIRCRRRGRIFRRFRMTVRGPSRSDFGFLAVSSRLPGLLMAAVYCTVLYWRSAPAEPDRTRPG